MAWRNSKSFIDGIQVHRGTTGSLMTSWDVYRRARQSTSGSRVEGVGGLHLTHTQKTFFSGKKQLSANAKTTEKPPIWHPVRSAHDRDTLRVRKTVQNRCVDLLATGLDQRNQRIWRHRW